MAASLQHNVYVGCETGILKGIDIESRKWTNLSNVEQVDKKNEVCCMCWASHEESQIHFATRNQVVKTYCTSTGELLETQPCPGGTGPIKGIGVHENSIVTCSESGSLKVWRNTEEQTEINVGENISRMRVNRQHTHQVATGGKENDLKVWDLNNTETPVFAAKNVRNDWLNLRVPIWVLDMDFLEDSKKIITCTGHHQVRIYDSDTPQRRPVMDIEFDEYPLTSLSLRPGFQQVMVGNTQGKMALIDLRKGHMIQQYKGFAGSIRGIQCSASSPVVATCSLDRHLRIHDINSRDLLQKLYLKSRLNCLLLRKDLSPSDENTQAGTEHAQVTAEEADEIWENMVEVGSKNMKRKGQDTETDSVDQTTENNHANQVKKQKQKRKKLQKSV